MADRARRLEEVAAALARLGPVPRDQHVDALFATELVGLRGMSGTPEVEAEAMEEEEVDLETCTDLVAAHSLLEGRKASPTTAAAAARVLNLLSTSAEVPAGVASYFVLEVVADHVQTAAGGEVEELVADLEQVLRRYPAVTEPLLARLLALPALSPAIPPLLLSTAPLLSPPALPRLLLLWLRSGRLAPSTITILTTFLHLQPDLLDTPAVSAAVAGAVAAAPAEADGCLKFAKWLLGAAGRLVAAGGEQVRGQLRSRAEANTTFLRTRLVATLGTL